MNKITYKNEDYFWELDPDQPSWWNDNGKYQYVKIYNHNKKQLDIYCGTSCMTEENNKENKEEVSLEIENDWVPDAIREWLEEKGDFVKRDTTEPDKMSYTELKKQNKELKEQIHRYGLDHRGTVYTYMIDYMSAREIPYQAHIEMFRRWLEQKDIIPREDKW